MSSEYQLAGNVEWKWLILMICVMSNLKWKIRTRSLQKFTAATTIQIIQLQQHDDDAKEEQKHNYKYTRRWQHFE